MHEIDFDDLIAGISIRETIGRGQDRLSAVKRLPRSGLYTRSDVTISPNGGGVPSVVETVRLDVDGSFPQLAASGTYHGNTYQSVYRSPEWWMAYPLAEKSDGVWEGRIIDHFPKDLSWFLHNSVRIHVPQSRSDSAGDDDYIHAQRPGRASGGHPQVEMEVAILSDGAF